MLEYIKTGKNGDYVLLIHGFCEWIGYWDGLVNKLSSTNQCLAINISGYGKSPDINPYTLENISLQINELLLSLKIEKIALVGHSMGGYISLAFCELYPDKVNKLVLLNSTAFADSDEKKVQRLKTVNYLNEHGVESFIKPFVPPLFYHKNRAICSKIIEDLIQNGILISKKTIENCTLAMRERPDRTDILKKAKFPILYIIGKNDSSVRLEDSISQCHLSAENHILILDEAGHQCLYEKEEIVVQSIQNFLK